MLALLLLVPLNLRSAIQLEKLSFLTLVASRFLNPQVHFNSLSSSILNQPSSVRDPQSSIRSSFLSYQSSTASHSWSPNIVAVVCRVQGSQPCTCRLFSWPALAWPPSCRLVPDSRRSQDLCHLRDTGDMIGFQASHITALARESNSPHHWLDFLVLAPPWRLLSLAF